MEKIAIDSVNIHDETCCISYPLEDGFLTDSIERYGIVSPLILLDTSPRTVVTGFRRLRAALRLGLRDVPCVLTCMNGREALVTAIMDNVMRRLNLVEIAHSVQKMTGLGFAAGEIEQLTGFVGGSSAARAIALLIAVANGEDAAKRFIVERGLPLGTVEYLFMLDDGERGQVLAALTRLRPTVSLIRDILRLLLLVRLRTGFMPLQPLQEAGDADSLRRDLKGIAEPALSELTRQLVDLRAGATIPPAIDVRIDPFFERDYVDVSIRVRDERDLDGAISTLTGLSKSGFFRSMLDLVRGNRRGN